MSGISRISGSGAISRDTPSSGHDAIAAREQRESQAPARNEKVDQVAKMYEKQFLREMVKAMRGTVSYGEMSKPGMAENIYRDQLDEQYVESWGDTGGIGLSDVIYDQIMDRYFGQSGRSLKSQGAITLTDRDVSRVMRVRPSGDASTGQQVPLRVEVKPSEAKSPAQVQTPWDAEVVHRSRVDGKTAVTLKHDDGIRSTLIFEGVPNAELEPGRKLSKGSVVGVLSPEINSFLWNLRASATSMSSNSSGRMNRAESPNLGEKRADNLVESPVQKAFKDTESLE